MRSENYGDLWRVNNNIIEQSSRDSSRSGTCDCRVSTSLPSIQDGIVLEILTVVALLRGVDM